MDWFRRKRRLVVALALCAFALQLTLSPAHIHAEQHSTPVSFAAAGEPDALDIDHEHGKAGSHCAICNFMQMAGASVIPVSAETISPDQAASICKHHLGVCASPSRVTLFDARAPPQA